MNPQPLPTTQIKSFFSKIPWWPGFVVAAIFLIVCIVFLILFIKKQPSAPSSTNLNQCNDTTCPHGTCVAGVCNYKCDESFNCPGNCDNNKCQPKQDCTLCFPKEDDGVTNKPFSVGDMKTWIDCNQEYCQGTGAIMANAYCKAPQKVDTAQITSKSFPVPFSGAALTDSLFAHDNPSGQPPTNITSNGQVGLAYTPPDKDKTNYTFNTCQTVDDIQPISDKTDQTYHQFVIQGRANLLS